MDVLHLNREEISAMDYVEYNEALFYSITAYITRKMISKKKEGEDAKGKTFGVDWSKLYPIDKEWIKKRTADAKALRELGKRSVIPERRKD